MLRLYHYSIHTERPSVEWIVRFVRFHGRRSREDLSPVEPKIESFLTNLSVHGHVAATQNQAMNALVVLYKRVLNHAMEGSINAVRADKKINVPVVMPREEVAAVISLLDGTTQLVAKLLYDSGLRIMEAVRHIGSGRATVLGWCKKLLGHKDVETTANKGGRAHRAEQPRLLGLELWVKAVPGHRTWQVEAGHGGVHGRVRKDHQSALTLAFFRGEREELPTDGVVQRCNACTSIAGAWDKKLASSFLPSRVRIDSG